MVNTESKVNAAYRRIQRENNVPSDNAAILVEMNFLCQKLESFQVNVLKEVDHRMSCMIDEIMQEMRQTQLVAHEFRNFHKAQTQEPFRTWNNCMSLTDTTQPSNSADAITCTTTSAVQQGSKGVQAESQSSEQATKVRRLLPNKVFVMRESFLTALLEVDHLKTIYHIFHIILLILLLNSICYDYFVEGRINFGLNTFKVGFEKLHYVLFILLLDHIFVFAFYYAFKSWAKVRWQLRTQRALQKFWSHSCLIVYISSQLVFGYVASALCLKLDLPFITASVLLLESTRLLMKMHAFVRTNAQRVIAPRVKNGSDSVNDAKGPTLPAFQRFLYFLFAPTLLYRDEYPRTTRIRWTFAFRRLLEVVAVAFLFSYLHERHANVYFHNFGNETLDANALIVKLFGMLMPGIIILLCGFYLVLHSWLNFTAEILRFGDRMFYKDWWTASTYETYFRNWNVVVHDFLYEYIYKDTYNYLFKGSKVAASIMVFMVSAIVHDYLLSFALQLFFPVMFVFFGVLGVAFVFITRNAAKNSGNMFIWFTLIIGHGLMVSLYYMEYYARKNCPLVRNQWIDFMIPVSWTCYKH